MAIKTEWNLKLLYKSESDPQIEKDVKKMEDLCAIFEKKYRGKAFTKNPQTLLNALKDSEKLDEFAESHSPTWYFHLKTDLNSTDHKATALSTKYGHRLTEAGNKLQFFGLEIAKIPANKQKTFLNSSILKEYKYSLKKTFETAKYNLSEGEEQLKSLLSGPAYGMWVDTQEKLLSKQSINHKGKEIPLSQASAQIADMPKIDRREVHQKINAVLKNVSDMAEGEINAIYNYKKIMDKRRGYKRPDSATIIGYENDEKAIENFVALVSKYFKISHRFYRLQAKLLKEKKLHIANRNVKMGEIKTKFDFKKSVSIMQKALGEVDKEFLDIFNSYLENGQIDVYPKKGKLAGAYCAGSGKLPTFILLNHVNDIRSLETLAHEMGHGFHVEFSKRQPIIYQGHSTATAEVASTLFEQLIADDVEKTLSKNEQIVLLHTRIMGDVSTIFRQIAFYNFELELHNQIREHGQVSKEDIAKLMSKHLKSYLGDAVDVRDEDGYFFVYLSHIRRFFYVYSYAYGQLISRALYENWKKDKSYISKIKQFLSAGRSMSPEDIFKSVGIDTSKPEFFEAGLKSVEADIAKLEKLTGKSGLK